MLFRYVRIDYITGDGVDEVVDAGLLVERFKEDSFDVVVSTEMLEHAENWRVVINGMKKILKPNGLLIITTRSPGFGYHGYPYDFWRYTVYDFKEIFSDLEILILEPDDRINPGVLLKARKPLDFSIKSLDNMALYSILNCKRELQVPKMPIRRRIVIRVSKFLFDLKISLFKTLTSQNLGNRIL